MTAYINNAIHAGTVKSLTKNNCSIVQRNTRYHDKEFQEKEKPVGRVEINLGA